MTLSLSNMGFRGVSNQTLFIADLCLLAGFGLLISAQWEMVRGGTFGYTVLAAFGGSLYLECHEFVSREDDARSGVLISFSSRCRVILRRIRSPPHAINGHHECIRRTDNGVL
jgi:hypothetical protein